MHAIILGQKEDFAFLSPSTARGDLLMYNAMAITAETKEISTCAERGQPP